MQRGQWEGCLPEICQQIRDPGAFFTVLGEVIAQRIDQHADYLAGGDQSGEGYLAKSPTRHPILARHPGHPPLLTSEKESFIR